MSDINNISLPDELLNELTFEDAFYPSNSETVGVAAFSQTNHSSHILRLYQLLLNSTTEEFEVVQELAAFQFENREQLTNFLIGLPALNGLEMLMLLNPFKENLTQPTNSGDQIN